MLVVAADDGVMPQTIEAINHARAARVPIIVAINKIDKPNANVDRVKQELAGHEVLVEGWGGDVPVDRGLGAQEDRGSSELLEVILLVAEMQDLKAVAEGPATRHRARGPQGEGPRRCRHGPGPAGDPGAGRLVLRRLDLRPRARDGRH